MKNSKPFSVKNKVDNTTQKLGSLFLLMLSCVFFFGVNLISAQEKEVESQDEYKPFSMSAHSITP